MTTTERINGIADRIEARKTEAAKAEATYEAAEKAHDKALATLKKDFKVNSLEEAEKLLAKLRKKADKLTDEAEAMLSD